MAHTICFEVFPRGGNVNKMRKYLVDRHCFTEKENKYGIYFTTEVPAMDAWQTKLMLARKGYKYRSFDRRYERSNNYRKIFFDNNHGPYHCVYCGKRLIARDLEVDHLIPVAKAKNSMGVRTWMQLCGIKNVNDSKNLVASCSRCNGHKSDKMGFWTLRGMIGRYKATWVARNIFVILLVLLVIYLLSQNAATSEFVKGLFGMA